MEIDAITLQAAQKVFESRYHSNFNDLGLSVNAKRRLLRYGKIPGGIKNTSDGQEYLNIASEYKNILNEVMRPHRPGNRRKTRKELMKNILCK